MQFDSAGRSDRHGFQTRLGEFLACEESSYRLCRVFGSWTADIQGCQEDALPTEIEKSEMYTEVEILKNLRKIEQIPTFTIRELTQALRRANSLSALGPDGVSSKIVKIACEDSEFQQLLLKAINNQVIVIGRTRRSLNLQK